MANNYTLGRGKVYFSRYLDGTETPEGFRYLGNTPEFSLTIESNDLDHFSSDEGIRELDDSVPLEVTRTGSLTTDNISAANVALFFFGSTTALTQVAVASAIETLVDVKAGHGYLLGVTPLNPSGYMGIDTTGFLVKKGLTTLVSGTDYTMDFDSGFLEFIAGGAVIDLDDIAVTYAVDGSTRQRVISGSSPVTGALMFVTKNPKGTDSRWLMNKVKMAPNGDYALKGDDWQQIPLSLSILKKDGDEAIYRDGIPTYA